MSAASIAKPYWLPESVTLKLTAFEAGALAAILYTEKVNGGCAVKVNKRGPGDQPVETTLIEVLLDKMNEAILPLYKEKQS
jgi:hypothetical protein